MYWNRILISASYCDLGHGEREKEHQEFLIFKRKESRWYFCSYTLGYTQKVLGPASVSQVTLLQPSWLVQPLVLICCPALAKPVPASSCSRSWMSTELEAGGWTEVLAVA